MVDNDRDGDGRFWYGEDEADEPSVLYTEEAVIEEKIDFSRARETFSRYSSCWGFVIKSSNPELTPAFDNFLKP